MTKRDDFITLVSYSVECAFEPLSTAWNAIRSFFPSSDGIELLKKMAKSPESIAFTICFVLIFMTFALAISRTTVVRLCSSSKSSTYASLKYSLVRWRSNFLTLCPLAVFLLISWGVLLFDSLTSDNAFAAFISALLALGASVAAGVVCAAIPLMTSAIAAQNCDGFDAISRGVSYLLERLAFFLLYACIAQVLLIVGCSLVSLASRTASYLFTVNYDETCSSCHWGALFLKKIPLSYSFVAAIAYSNAIYILLRRSVDGTSHDECALDLTGNKPRELRSILKEGKGAPTFDAQRAERESVSTKVQGKDETN
ncbi:MAG: hypothetical protein ACI4NP_01800 [Thermoguttaceae bacterium]